MKIIHKAVWFSSLKISEVPCCRPHDFDLIAALRNMDRRWKRVTCKLCLAKRKAPK